MYYWIYITRIPCNDPEPKHHLPDLLTFLSAFFSEANELRGHFSGGTSGKASMLGECSHSYGNIFRVPETKAVT